MPVSFLIGILTRSLLSFVSTLDILLPPSHNIPLDIPHFSSLVWPPSCYFNLPPFLLSIPLTQLKCSIACAIFTAGSAVMAGLRNKNDSWNYGAGGAALGMFSSFNSHKGRTIHNLVAKISMYSIVGESFALHLRLPSFMFSYFSPFVFTFQCSSLSPSLFPSFSPSLSVILH